MIERALATLARVPGRLPAIVGGKVIGVDSYGPVGCGGPAHCRRIDPHESGGCAAGGGACGWLALGVIAVLARRSRRCR